MPTGSVEKGTDIVLGYGLLGVVCLALVFVCWRLWTRIDKLQDERAEVGRELGKLIEASTNAMEKLTEAIRGRAS